MAEVKARVPGQVQITTDGFKPYIPTLDATFGADCDYAMLIEGYGTADEGTGTYSPARITAIFHQVMWGEPDEKRICTSHVERQNLTCRCRCAGSRG